MVALTSGMPVGTDDPSRSTLPTPIESQWNEVGGHRRLAGQLGNAGDDVFDPVSRPTGKFLRTAQKRRSQARRAPSAFG